MCSLLPGSGVRSAGGPVPYLDSRWCVALLWGIRYTLLCSFAGCRCWAPAPGAAALAGVLRLALVYGRFGVFASSWLWGAFCRWPCPVLYLDSRWCFALLALAGVLRLALVYGRFGVFASSWLWGAFCRWPCHVLGFPLVFRFVMGYTVYSSLLLCWLPLLGACSLRCGSCRPPEVSFGLQSFWCAHFFLALGCVLLVALSRYGVYSSLLLCWLPLLGACPRRCGSCRRPEVSFGLRSFWCVRFFLALGCVLPVALSRTWIPAGVSLCYGVYSSLFFCWLSLLGACSLRCGSCRRPEVSFVYFRFGVFASSWLWGAFCRWPCPVLGFPLVFRFVMGYTVYSSLLLCWLPLLGACSRRCGSCRRPEVSFGLRPLPGSGVRSALLAPSVCLVPVASFLTTVWRC